MKFKKLILFIAVVFCLCLLPSAVACVSTDKNENSPMISSDGTLIVVNAGAPASGLGEDNDVCLSVAAGDFYRKIGSDWVKVKFESYDVKDGNLTVTYGDGEVGVYSIPETKANDICSHELSEKLYTVYGAKCVIPGIGVRSCTKCRESFVEIIPADGATHSEFDEANYGRCSYCGHLESGIPGYEIKDDSKLEEVLGQVEDGDTVVLGTDVTIKDTSSLNVSNKSITLDVQGHDVNIEKAQKESKGLCVDGGSLIITDSSSSEDPESRGKFTLTVNEADNQSSRDKGTYAMRVNNADLKITNVDFEIINNTKNYSHAMYVTGGTINVESDAKLIMKQGKNAEDKQTNGGYGMFLSEGAEMNLNGATVESEGPIHSFVVGNSVTENVKDTVLNLNAGTVINYRNSACSYGAITVYPKGVVNMYEGSKIVVDGAAIDPRLPIESAGSNAMALSIIGGGTINMEGGEINLSVSRGMAYGVSILNNYWYNDPDAELPSHIALDAHCKIGTNAKIIGTNAEVGGGVMFFAAQRNGKEEVLSIDEDGQPSSYGELSLKTGDDMYSVVIEQGASILLNGQEVKKGDFSFAMTDSYYPGTGHPNDHLGWFTSDAIKDMRT